MPLAISSSDTQYSNNYGLFWILKKCPRKISAILSFFKIIEALSSSSQVWKICNIVCIFFIQKDVLCIRVWPDADVCECQERERRWKNRVCMYLVRYLTPFSYEKNNRPLGESKSLNKKKFGTRSRKHDIFYLVML